MELPTASHSSLDQYSSSPLPAMNPEAESLLSCLYTQPQKQQRKFILWGPKREELVLRCLVCLEILQNTSLGLQKAEAQLPPVQGQPEITWSCVSENKIKTRIPKEIFQDPYVPRWWLWCQTRGRMRNLMRVSTQSLHALVPCPEEMLNDHKWYSVSHLWCQDWMSAWQTLGILDEKAKSMMETMEHFGLRNGQASEDVTLVTMANFNTSDLSISVARPALL